MISPLANGAWLPAPLGASVGVLPMCRRLRRRGRMPREYRAATETSSHALRAARSSIDLLNWESRRLGALLGEATSLGMAVLTRLSLAAGAPRQVQDSATQWPGVQLFRT